MSLTPREHLLHKILWFLLRPFFYGVLVVGLLYWPVYWARQSLGFSPQAHARSIDDYLSFNLRGPFPSISIPLETDYKKLRAREICQMATDTGIGDYCHEMIAHLLRECGSMTEYCDWSPGKSSNDHGWAIGLAQWHIWYRYRDWAVRNHFAYTYTPAKVAAMREQFFHDFPEMNDWRGQARKYIAEMAGCTGDGHTIWHCIDTWNANPAYLSQVKGQLANAKSILSPL